jgi:hypothetical protein
VVASVTRSTRLRSSSVCVRSQRTVGITRYGQVAVVAAMVLWVMAYVVAGTAMYLFAYGIVLLLVVAYFIAPEA